MRRSLQKTISISFFTGAIALFILLLSLIFNRDIWIDTEFYLLMLSSIMLCGCLSLHFAKGLWAFAQNKKYMWYLCFFLYLVFLSYLLFFSKDFARDRVDFLNTNDYIEYLHMQWKYSVNLMPFETIRNMITVWNTWYMQYSFINLIGNLVAFMPFAFFLKLLHKNMTWKRFFLTMSIIIISVEIIQFFTLTGSMDIDDYILNITGAMLYYAILSIPFFRKHIQNLTNKISQS